MIIASSLSHTRRACERYNASERLGLRSGRGEPTVKDVRAVHYSSISKEFLQSTSLEQLDDITSIAQAICEVCA